MDVAKHGNHSDKPGKVPGQEDVVQSVFRWC